MDAQAFGTKNLNGKPIAEEEWSTGFWDCFSDCKNCCITCWCPCITFRQVAKIIDRGSTTLSKVGAFYACISTVTGCGCIYSYFYRGKMRAQYNLRGSDFGDFCRHFLCEVCALTQEYRELKNRGFDMNLGWEENMERQQNRGVAMGAPVVQDGMTRY